MLVQAPDDTSPTLARSTPNFTQVGRTTDDGRPIIVGNSSEARAKPRNSGELRPKKKGLKSPDGRPTIGRVLGELGRARGELRASS